MGVNFIKPKLTDEEKERFLLAAITAECEAEDRANSTVNIPYFMRARQRLDNIKMRGELEQEYKNYARKGKQHA